MFIILDEEGTPMSRPHNMVQQVDPLFTTKVIEFNDIAALETRSRPETWAAVLPNPS